MALSSVAAAGDTRTAIVERAVQLASVEGLEGLTFGRLAADLNMSKAGVVGHFGSKERLQLAALEAALEVFRREVWDKTAAAEPGLLRLLAICDAWISYLERGVFPGGCFLTAAACEFDGREGPVRDALVAALSGWRELLEWHARTAVEAGDLPPGTDPAWIAFQLGAIAAGANQALQLFGDGDAPRHARHAMRAVLSVTSRRAAAA
jgi:AcrR family transcriptional regulator